MCFKNERRTGQPETDRLCVHVRPSSSVAGWASGPGGEVVPIASPLSHCSFVVGAPTPGAAEFPSKARKTMSAIETIRDAMTRGAFEGAAPAPVSRTRPVLGSRRIGWPVSKKTDRPPPPEGLEFGWGGPLRI